MSQQNNQPVIPFEIGMQQVVNKWKQMGWVWVYLQNSYALYDKNLQRICDQKTVRALVYRYIASDVAVPIREDKFQAVVLNSLNQLPLVEDVYGTYRPDIRERLIPNENGRTFTVNTCHVYEEKTSPAQTDIGLIQPWLTIMAGLFPDTHERKRVIQYFAHALQKPMDKPSFALLITGAQGNGKSSMLINVFDIVFGETYITTFHNVSQLSTSIGAQRYGNRLFAFVDDFADQTEKTSEKLKPVITSHTAVAKKLYCDEKEIHVITRFIFISNEHQPIPFYDGHDRRYYAPAYAPAQDVSQTVDRFLAQLRDDSRTRDALYRYLMAYDISDFNPHVPEETRNHARMVGGSTSTVIQQFTTIMNVERPEYITRNWYEHMMMDYFNTPLTPSQLDKQWRQVVAYMKSKTDWVSKKIHTKIDDTDVWLVGWAIPDFDVRYWTKNVFTPLPEHQRGKWLFPVKTY
ncbi:hypothetical protein HVW28_24670 (plasmid) [Escherichia coli]|nr:hypothetical protein HVW28_24670 [Escherichia coli]